MVLVIPVIWFIWESYFGYMVYLLNLLGPCTYDVRTGRGEGGNRKVDKNGQGGGGSDKFGCHIFGLY